MNPKLHCVNVGKDGRFSSDGQISSTPEDVQWMFGKLGELKPQRLLLVLHGGLVDEARALKGISEIHGKLTSSGIHPIYIVWETGLFDILKDIAGESLGRGWFKKALGYLLRALKMQFPAIGDADGIHAFSAETFREVLMDADPEAPELERQLEAHLDELISSDFDQGDMEVLELPAKLRGRLQEYAPADATLSFNWLWLVKALAAVAIRCIRRFATQRDHGALTITEEVLRELYVAKFGERVWGEMKERAEEMWWSNENVGRPDLHAGRYFLSSLEAYLRSNPGVTIDVVGHSAGAIATCEMLEAISRDGLAIRPRNLLLLAPACTTGLFHDRIGKPANENRFGRVLVYTMNDAAERADKLVPFVYPASLLYAISGFLEKEPDAPLLGLERHIRGEYPYGDEPVAEFLREPGRLFLSPTSADAPDGARCQARTHAGFADDGDMLASIIHHALAVDASVAIEPSPTPRGAPRVSLRSFADAGSEAKAFAESAVAVLERVLSRPRFFELLRAQRFSSTWRRTHGGGYARASIAQIIEIISEGVELDTAADRRIDLQVALESMRAGTLGYVNIPAPLITTNMGFFEDCRASKDPLSLASHWMHEWMHVAGFYHPRFNRTRDVAYRVGHLVAMVGAELLRVDGAGVANVGPGALFIESMQEHACATSVENAPEDEDQAA